VFSSVAIFCCRRQQLEAQTEPYLRKRGRARSPTAHAQNACRSGTSAAAMQQLQQQHRESCTIGRRPAWHTEVSWLHHSFHICST
jgi:hypothetical protein